MENEKWFNKEIQEVEEKLQTDVEKGLSQEEIASRHEKYGFNELKSQKKKTLVQRFLEQFKH